MISEKQLNAYKKYVKKLARYTIQFNKENDADIKIIEHLKKIPNKNDYIRQLIIKDMEKNGNKSND